MANAGRTIKIVENGERDRDNDIPRESNAYGNGHVSASGARPATAIPTNPRISMEFDSGSLMGFTSFEDISFTNRGSIMLGGRKAGLQSGLRQNGTAARASRVLSTDEEHLSQRVRAMYEIGEEGGAVESTYPNGTVGGRGKSESRTQSQTSTPRPASMIKRQHEIAGGIEDWEDVSGGEVDRYGFIMPKRPGSHASGRSKMQTPDLAPPQRMSTVLQMASESPRGSKRRLRRTGSGRASSTQKSVNSQNSLPGTGGSGYSRKPLRNAANRLPGRKNQRLMDEAGDMLTLPPGLADIAEEADGGKTAQAMRRREWARAEKWRKMARPERGTEGGTDGKGMVFSFDTRDSKLVSRTWKGIPDRWRATAWHSFLNASAARDKSSASDEELIEEFYELVDQSSADDVQIDLDVPRTINSHIMFRRRYRGGQRLLFRVLHALSLYFPDVGYVQGMASLAATLLCYYEEEMAFVMLVRLFRLRGLEGLYQSGFDGLMDALGVFETRWLASNKEVAKQLNELGVGPTAYGTRWYLTLFNYSIPFAAQLRVWDVFMLLGEGGRLDVLHATSAALIDATRDVILDADFENAMKVLTSWIPVRDEDLLMRVAKVEYRRKRVAA